MTDERMALLELIEKGTDADLVRELLAYASERPLDCAPGAGQDQAAVLTVCRAWLCSKRLGLT